MAKILFISHMFPHQNNFSYGKVIYEQALSIEDDHQIIIIAPVPYVPPFFKYFKKKYKIYHQIERENKLSNLKIYYPRYFSLGTFLFCYSGFFMFLGIKKVIRKLHKKYHFDLIHAHFTHPDGYAAAKLSQALQLPLIITLQATDLNYTINKCPQKLFYAFQNANKIISPTPILAKRLRERWGFESEIIGYGIDKDKVLRGNLNKRIEKLPEKKVLLTVSRLLKSKGIEDAIKAIGALQKRYNNLLYIIIGDGEEKAHLINLVKKLNLQQQVIFLGWKSREIVMEYLRIADIFLLPSYRETFGLVYLEAMVHSVPVIGCQGQGLDGIIKNYENGFLANPQDFQSIISIIDFIFQNPLQAKEIAIKGKITADEFTFPLLAHKLNQIYLEVIGGK